MIPDARLVGLFERLMDVNREAFDTGHYEVAYHALMAALHAAADLDDDAAVAAVRNTAESQGAWIDTHAAGHRLSTRSAAAHGGHSVFATTATHAAAVAARSRAGRALADARSLRNPPPRD
jgi:hypothetical protein